MKDLICIDKTALLKRIEELDKEIPNHIGENYQYILIEEKSVINRILNSSTLSAQEVFNAARGATYTAGQATTGIKWDYKTLEEFIENREL